AGERRKHGEPRLLQPHIVVIVEVVEADYPVAPIEQRFGNVETDKPGGAGEKDRHKAPGVRRRLQSRGGHGRRSALSFRWTLDKRFLARRRDGGARHSCSGAASGGSASRPN